MPRRATRARSPPRSKRSAPTPRRRPRAPPAPRGASSRSSGPASARATWRWSTAWSPRGGAEPGPMERVLLITPCRDEAEHLERTLASVAAQTRPPDLWLIVDDGSTDATPEILRRWAARLPYLQVLGTRRRARAGADGLATAAEAVAFNGALHS